MRLFIVPNAEFSLIVARQSSDRTRGHHERRENFLKLDAM